MGRTAHLKQVDGYGERGVKNESNYSKHQKQFIRKGSRFHSWKIRRTVAIVVLVCATVYTTKIKNARLDFNLQEDESQREWPVFTCPEATKQAENYDEKLYSRLYIEGTNRIQKNLTSFLETFRDQPYDGWAPRYNDTKEKNTGWKTSVTRYLKDGDSIYESACGIGLNLMMTVELAYEMHGIQNLHVYGNEYLSVNAKTANEVFDQLAPQMATTSQAQKGIICQGDSTNLSFVPANSFDFVYTGYVSPFLDPLELTDGSKQSKKKYYSKLCDKSDEYSKDLNQLAQERQNDWFASWTSEMIRIAKPGAPIVLEEVSYPFCDVRYDYGGVPKEFWAFSVQTYNWDVDPFSIDIKDSAVAQDRYHVFMLKNK